MHSLQQYSGSLAVIFFFGSLAVAFFFPVRSAVIIRLPTHTKRDDGLWDDAAQAAAARLARDQQHAARAAGEETLKELYSATVGHLRSQLRLTDAASVQVRATTPLPSEPSLVSSVALPFACGKPTTNNRVDAAVIHCLSK